MSRLSPQYLRRKLLAQGKSQSKLGPRERRRPRANDPRLCRALLATGVSLAVFDRNERGNMLMGGRDRRGDVSLARWLVWAWLRSNADMSLPAIARVTGVSHSSVFEGLQRLKSWQMKHVGAEGSD